MIVPPFARRLSFVLLALALPACGGWTQAHRDNAMNEFRRTTLPKAAFSMECAEAQIEIKLVPEGDAFPKSALVSGCGKRASYVRVGTDWLMESGPGK